VSPGLTITAARYEVIVLEGCDGTGKTTLATTLAARHDYSVIHSGRTPDDVDLLARYRSILAIPGRSRSIAPSSVNSSTGRCSTAGHG
jgi:ABC-type branched-subunit amino acid transport system ATPase component